MDSHEDNKKKKKKRERTEGCKRYQRHDQRGTVSFSHRALNVKPSSYK